MPHTSYEIECSCGFYTELSESFEPVIRIGQNATNDDVIIAHSEDGNDLIEITLSDAISKKLKKISDNPLRNKIFCPKCKVNYLSFSVSSFSD